MKISGDRREMNTIRPKYRIPKKGFSLKMEYPNAKLKNNAKRSYTTLNLCLMRCLKMGMNPKMHKLMNRSVNTFDVLFSLDDSKIEAKKIALMEVGLPRNTLADAS